METKYCNKCKKTKPLIEFNFYKTGKRTGKPRSWCKICSNNSNKLLYIRTKDHISKKHNEYHIKNLKNIQIQQRMWHNSHPNYAAERNHITKKSIPMSKAKDSAAYLGIFIAERALSKFFEEITRMPNGNPGFDFICKRGFKIDVKSRCISDNAWGFNIHKNKIANYFLCIAFDNRTNLTPLHVWLIPGKIINEKHMLYISNSINSLAKWLQYEKPLDKVNTCCSIMRAEVST